MELAVPYTQQFSPQQTPLKRLLSILRQNSGNTKALRSAIASAFFKDTTDPNKIAGNTLIAMRAHGILAKGTDDLTAFGTQLIALRGKDDEAHTLLARHLLTELNCIGIIETIREMRSAALKISLATLPDELRRRGFKVSSNSSDLSGVLGWLKTVNLLTEAYDINEAVYVSLVGTQPVTMDMMKGLSREQIAFLRAAVALNVTDWTPYNSICKQAEALYQGEIRYNWKEIVGAVLKPLVSAGFIELRKQAKQQQDIPEGRGGKTGDIKPTKKFDEQIAGPLLSALYRSAGFAEIREIRSNSLAQIVEVIEKDTDQNKRGKALEWLAIRLCQMLDLDFMGWRETDTAIAGGGEVDALLHSSRLIYSRWQLQCKVGELTIEAVAKEVGMNKVTLANVILVVGTRKATKGAETYRRQIVGKSRMGLRPGPPSGSGPATAAEPASGASPATPATGRVKLDAAYQTKFGKMFCGDSLNVLPALIDQGVRVKLIMTSPPFALVRKKSYGNEDSDRYVEWFEKFIPYFKEILDPTGSLVIDIGGAWLKGLPAKSTYHFKLLLNLCESGFFLAQDFYHYNPARLPTPAEWVTIRRMRVKDAVNSVFWLAQDPFVDADNRRVLAPYSDSMKELLKNGYKAALRPSGHNISTKFQTDNAGSIPPNLFQFANTASTGHYLRRCKEEA